MHATEQRELSELSAVGGDRAQRLAPYASLTQVEEAQLSARGNGGREAGVGQPITLEEVKRLQLGAAASGE